MKIKVVKNVEEMEKELIKNGFSVVRILISTSNDSYEKESKAVKEKAAHIGNITRKGNGGK